MTPGRRQQIEALYRSALDMEPAKRTAFLQAACAEDAELRHEVQSLLDGGPTETLISHEPFVTAGSRLGPYKVEAALGAGGMGEVFRAMDTRLHRTVAIKILPRDKVADPERRQRFLQEARAASALNHPNIVVLHDIAEHNGIDYLVMEYVAGTPLDKYIPSNGLPTDEAIGYTIQIAAALAAAHAAGIVHRDIKPANIMITAGKQIKVLDFGLAKLDQARAIGDDAASLTKTGFVMGTLPYMSPEQARGEDVDARTDLFALGALFYEMLTGQRAFPGRFDWTAPPLVVLPANLRPIVLKLLQPDREERYRNATEILADLEPQRPARLWPKSWKPFAALIAAALILAAGALYFFHRPTTLTDRDTILLADFDNKTGDTVFDDTLRQGLAVQLEQSPFLSIIGDQRIQATLGMMGRPADARLTSTIARELCTRADGAAVIEGSIAPLGSQYVIGLRARNCGSGSMLADEQTQAARKEDVLSGLSQMAVRFRSRLGESIATVGKHNTPLEEATTRSLDALKAYSTAVRVWNAKGPTSAEPLIRHAIDLDPEFAMAWSFLGRIRAELYEPVEAAVDNAKAYQLRTRVSDPERFFIMVPHDLDGTGNLEKARQTAESWAANYPRDVHPRGYLSLIDGMIGRSDKSAEDARIAVGLDPHFPPAFGNLSWASLQLNRLDDAESAIRQSMAMKTSNAEYLVIRCYIAFLRGDRAAFEKEASQNEGDPEVGDWILQVESAVLAWDGHLRKARDKSSEAVDVTRKDPHGNERGAMWEAGTAVREALFGNSAEASKCAQAALDLSKGRDVRYGAALAFALSGDIARSKSLAKEMEAAEEDTLVRFNYAPTLHALWALNQGNAQDAIEQLLAAAPYELGAGPAATGLYGILYPAYVRGEAYLAAHRYSDAMAEFGKIVDHPGLVVADPVGVMARLQLARAQAKSGDIAKAKAAYQNFLTHWKGADPDIPILQQATTEYAKL